MIWTHFFHVYKWFYLRPQFFFLIFFLKNLLLFLFGSCFWYQVYELFVSLKSWRFSTMISLKGVVLCFTLKFMIHFELLFVRGGRLTFWLMWLQLFHHNSLKKLSLVLWIVFAPLSIINWTFLCWCISHFSSVPLIYESFCPPSLCCFDYCNCMVRVIPLNLFFFSKIFFLF